jgi:hypothetical protein
MSGQCRGSASLAARSELEEAWKRQCKYSTAGSRRAACKYSTATMPPSLRDFAKGGPYYKTNPPLKPMSGADFEKWRSRWEQEQAWRHAWEKKHAWRGRGAPGAEEAATRKRRRRRGRTPSSWRR